MSSAASQAPVPRGRRRTGETRAMLIESCIELVRLEGLGALTVQRITAAACITPQGFYKHFANTEELLQVAVGGRIEQVVGEQARIQAVVFDSPSEGLPSQKQMREALDRMYGLTLQEPRFSEIYLRYRADPTMLGGALVSISTAIRDVNTAYYWSIAQRMGARPEDHDRIAIHSENIMGLYYQGAEMLLSGRFERTLLVDTIFKAMMALLDQVLSERVDP